MSAVILDEAHRLAGFPRLYACQCGAPVFFRNDVCLRCKTPLGYEPGAGRVVALAPGPELNTWIVIGSPQSAVFEYCGNATSPAACNWLVPAHAAEGAQVLCPSCRLNRTIPDLSTPRNAAHWRTIEEAKRRLVSALLGQRLPVKSRLDEDPEQGLAFDFLADPNDGPRVLTGYNDGIVTLNIEEADTACRERTREQMHEPYRTVLGHLRHEVGHYYWQRLVEQTPHLDGFRELFGDERAGYAEALERHYRQGPPPDWQANYISAYASAHPSEDWAETWAHYLHIVDTVQIVVSFHLDINSVEMPFEAFAEDALIQPDEPFLDLLNSWIRFTAVLNEFSRSMGLPDFYPFVLSRSSVRKLHFVHLVVVSRQYG